MKVRIRFNSHVMDNDSVVLEGYTPEDIRQQFIDWCESRGLDWETTDAYVAEELND